jgi:hypothetical protein
MDRGVSLDLTTLNPKRATVCLKAKKPLQIDRDKDARLL